MSKIWKSLKKWWEESKVVPGIGQSISIQEQTVNGVKIKTVVYGGDLKIYVNGQMVYERRVG